MTEVTYNSYEPSANSSCEVFDITTVADGYTLTSRKFTNPVVTNISLVGSMGAGDAYSVSSTTGSVMTLKCVGTTNARLIVTVSHK